MYWGAFGPCHICNAWGLSFQSHFLERALSWCLHVAPVSIVVMMVQVALESAPLDSPHPPSAESPNAAGGHHTGPAIMAESTPAQDEADQQRPDEEDWMPDAALGRAATKKKGTSKTHRIAKAPMPRASKLSTYKGVTVKNNRYVLFLDVQAACHMHSLCQLQAARCPQAAVGKSTCTTSSRHTARLCSSARRQHNFHLQMHVSMPSTIQCI